MRFNRGLLLRTKYHRRSNLFNRNAEIQATTAVSAGWRLPTQRVIQSSRLQEVLDVSDADIAAALHIFAGEPGTAISVVKLLRASTGGPMRAKTREHAAA